VLRKLGIYATIIFLFLFITLTWRFWQFEVIGYRLGTEVGEYGRVDTYLTQQLAMGKTKDEVYRALKPIPHEISSGFILHYAPDDTAECYQIDFPRWLLIYRVESSRTICFNSSEILNYTEIHTS
jgi:hypothetical protein